MRKERSFGSNCGCCFLFEKKILERFVQCHVFFKSPPDRRRNVKYPVNNSYRSDLCYLVAKVHHLESVRC